MNPLPNEDVRSAEPVERRRSRLPAVMAVLVVAVGAAAAVASLDLQYWTELGPGPGFFPRWLGILLCVFGALWFVALVRGRGGMSGEPATPTTADGATPEPDAAEYSMSTVVAIVVSLCVLAGALEILGYQLSMLLFLLFHLRVLARRGLLLCSVLALAGSVGVFVVFTRLLSVSLPASSIPFLRDMGF